MSETCEVVIVMTDSGPVRMNKADYDPAVHILEGDDVPHMQLASEPATSNGPPVYAVAKFGKRFFVTDAAGNKVTNDANVDPNGYESDGAAWAAALPKTAGV